MGMGKNEGDLLAAPKNETGQATVHRAKFLDEFVRLVPQDICHFGKRLVDLQELETGKIKLIFKDGDTAECDCLVGADGVHSVIRSYLLGDDPAVEPVFTSSVAYRGLIPMDKAVAAIGKSSLNLKASENSANHSCIFLGEEYAQNSFVWCGYGGCVSKAMGRGMAQAA